MEFKTETQLPQVMLGQPDDIRNNDRVMVCRWPNRTKVHIAKKFPGCFAGHSDMEWGRRLSDFETESIMHNPWQMFGQCELERILNALQI